MNDQQPRGWKKLYQAALLELNPAELPDTIAAAEAAIASRSQVLLNSPDGHAENLEIRDALFALNALKRDSLNSSRIMACR